MLRQIGGSLYIINRDLGSVVIVDAKTDAIGATIQLGATTNPQDLAVVGDALYVPVLGGSGVAVLSQSGASLTKTIDLHTAIGDNTAGALPSCVSAYAVGTDVYVACGDLLDFVPNGPGKIVVIDSDDRYGAHDDRHAGHEPAGQLRGAAERRPADRRRALRLLVAVHERGEGLPRRRHAGHDADRDVRDQEQRPEWPRRTRRDLGHDRVHRRDRVRLQRVGALQLGHREQDAEHGPAVAREPRRSPTLPRARTARSSSPIRRAAGCGFYRNGAETTAAALPFGIAPGDGNGLVCYDR